MTSTEDVIQEQSETSVFDKDYNLNKISKEQYNEIVKNILNGKVYKHFDIKEHAKGGVTLVRKKQTPIRKPTKRTEKLLHQSDDDDIPQKTYLSPTQQLMEHVIEIREMMGAFKTKNKKRKKEIADIYSIFNPPIEQEELGNTIKSEPVSTPASAENKTERNEPKPQSRFGNGNLRSRLSYLA